MTMIALAAPKFAETPWPDWRRLVSIETAAERLERATGTLARDCRDSLEPAGMAYFGRHPNGGQEKWFILVDYDARLAPGPIGEDWQEPDLSGFGNRKRETALQRRACAEALQQSRASGRATGDMVGRLIDQLRGKYPDLGISRSRLYEWAKLYRRPADTVKLIDNRGGDRSADTGNAWSIFKGLYLDEGRPAISRCWEETDRVAKARGLTWCSQAACYAQLNDRISIEQQMRIRFPEIYRTQMAPYISQDPEAFAAGKTGLAIIKIWTCGADGMTRSSGPG